MQTPDDKAYAFYLIALLLMVAFWYVIGHRNRLGDKLQQAAIWGLIFVGVVIAYGFKDTLKSQLFPSEIVRVTQDSVSVKRGRDGHFHLTLNINGQDIKFVVDTGASAIVLTKKAAQTIGIDTNSLVYLGTAATANGMVRTAGTTLGVVKLGPFTDYDLRASVNEGELFDPLLGMTYLNTFQEITINGDTLTLRR